MSSLPSSSGCRDPADVEIPVKKRQVTIEYILAANGHTVLRLAPYHPELNPIEKIWGIVKNRVATRNITFKLDDVKKLTIEEFSKITPDDWSSVCRYIDNIEKDYISREYITITILHTMDQYCETFIINLTSDSEDDIFNYFLLMELMNNY